MTGNTGRSLLTNTADSDTSKETDLQTLTATDEIPVDGTDDPSSSSPQRTIAASNDLATATRTDSTGDTNTTSQRGGITTMVFYGGDVDSC